MRGEEVFWMQAQTSDKLNLGSDALKIHFSFSTSEACALKLLQILPSPALRAGEGEGGDIPLEI